MVILYSMEYTAREVRILTFYKVEVVQMIVNQERETFWTTQKTMAEVFNVKKNTINYHLKNIFDDGDLDQISVVRKIRTTAYDGKLYNNFCDLVVIISVGYRVNSRNATRFRIWSTPKLKKLVIKGFVLDDSMNHP